MKKNLLISTGGSGGHVIPAVTFYDHLKDNFEIFLTTDERGSKFIDKEKYEFEIISGPRLTKNIIKLPIRFVNFIISILKSILFLKKRKIDIMIGTGGYMSLPICLAAKILKIDIYLFEPNMVIGRSNKFLIKFSNKIFCYSEEIDNFPKSQKNKMIIVKNILRKKIYSIDNSVKKKLSDKINLLVIGGSQGAKIFDEKIKNCMVILSKRYKLMVYHQVSSKDFSNLDNFYKENNIKNKLFNFEENIFQYIEVSNLAITRAGASTLSELAFLKVPFIAIPYKFATDDHQLRNALYYKKNECCWVLEENDLNQDKLTKLLINIIVNKDDYLNKKNNLAKFCYQNTWNNINEKIINSLNEN